MNTQINVEVIYALPQAQTLLSVSLPQGGTVAEAIKLSGILDQHAEIDIEKNKLGIFGKLSKADLPNVTFMPEATASGVSAGLAAAIIWALAAGTPAVSTTMAHSAVARSDGYDGSGLPRRIKGSK